MNKCTSSHTPEKLSQAALREVWKSLPAPVVESIDNIVMDMLEALGDEGFRVSYAKPVEDLKMAVMKYCLETELIIFNKDLINFNPFRNLSSINMDLLVIN